MTAALILPVTTGISSAQSSFVSGSSSSAETPGTNHGSKANQLKEAAERVLVANGQIKSPTAEASAKKFIQRALNSEIPFVDDAYENIDYQSMTMTVVGRIPVSEIDERLDNVKNGEDEIWEMDGVSIPFGVATGKDDNYYYLAFSLIVG